MKITLREIAEDREELLVEINKDEINVEREKKIATLARNAEIRGFRKGHAPRKTIERVYDAKIRKELLEDYYKQAIEQAEREYPARMTAYISLKDVLFSDDMDLSFVIAYPVIPKVKDLDYKGLEYTDILVEVRDEEIDRVIDNIRNRLAHYQTVDRASQIGDFVLASFAEDKEGKEPQLMEVLPEGPGVFDLVGLKAGDEAEREIKIPEEHHDTSIAGRTGRFNLKIVAIQEKILPQINDELAKEANLGETLLEMRLKLREEINKQKEEDRKKSWEEELIDKLIERKPIPIPNEMLEEASLHGIEDMKKHYPKAFLTNPELEKTLFQREMENNKRLYRWQLLKEYIIMQEGIATTRDEAIAALKKEIKEDIEEDENYKDKLAKYVEREIEILNEDKVFNLLIAHGKKVTKQENPKAEEDKPAEEIEKQEEPVQDNRKIDEVE